MLVLQLACCVCCCGDLRTGKLQDICYKLPKCTFVYISVYLLYFWLVERHTKPVWDTTHTSVGTNHIIYAPSSVSVLHFSPVEFVLYIKSLFVQTTKKWTVYFISNAGRIAYISKIKSNALWPSPVCWRTSLYLCCTSAVLLCTYVCYHILEAV